MIAAVCFLAGILVGSTLAILTAGLAITARRADTADRAGAQPHTEDPLVALFGDAYEPDDVVTSFPLAAIAPGGPDGAA